MSKPPKKVCEFEIHRLRHSASRRNGALQQPAAAVLLRVAAH
jgi:hypothetical protein